MVHTAEKLVYVFLCLWPRRFLLYNEDSNVVALTLEPDCLSVDLGPPLLH